MAEVSPPQAKRSDSLLSRYRWSVVAAVVSVAFFFNTILSSIQSGSLGFDFGVFRSGAELSQREGWDVAYGAERASQYLADAYFPHIADTPALVRFISPPPFALLARAFTIGPFELAFGVWLVAGVVALVLSTYVLGVPRWVAVVFLLSPMIAVNTWLGQTGAFVLLGFALLHRSMVNRRDVAVGVLIGLMILKPVLAVGYGLLLLIDLPRSRRALGVSAGVAALLTVPTLIGGLTPWREFAGAIQNRADIESAWSQQSLAVAEVLKFLVPNGSAGFTLFSWVAGIFAAAVLLLVARRRFGNDPEVMSCVAVIATVVGSPHLLVYDLLILAIPVAVMWKRGYLSGDRVGILATCIVASIAFGPALNRLQFVNFGRAISIEFLGLVIACSLAVRWWSRSESQASKPGQSGEPATTDIGEFDFHRS